MVSSRNDRLVNIPTTITSHIICIVVAVAMVVIASLFIDVQPSCFSGFVNTNFLIQTLSTGWAATINFVSLLLLMAISLTISNRFSLTSTYSVLTTLMFMMLQCCCPKLYLTYNIGIAGAIMVMVFVYYLFEYYSVNRVEKMVYGVTLLLCALSLVWCKILFFIPLFWVGMMQLNMFTLRSISASLMAVSTVVVMVLMLSHLGWIDIDASAVRQTLKGVVLLKDYQSLQIVDLYPVLYILPAFLVVLVYNVELLYRDSQDKISIKRYVVFFNTLLFATLLLMILNPLDINQYIPVFNSVSAVLIARYFDEIKSKIKLRILMLLIIVYLSIYFVWIWFPNFQSGVI